MSAAAGKIRSAIAILGMGLALYWAVTYSGPYRYLAEFQLKQFGSYAPKLTALVIGLAFFLLGELVKMLLRGTERPVHPVSTPPISASTPALAPKSPSNLSAYKPLLILAVPLVMGVYFLLTGMSAGPLRELQIADFADAGLPSHTVFAEVYGYVDRSRLSQNNSSYVPMREAPNASTPIRLVVGVDENKMTTQLLRQDDGSVVVRGMLEPRLDNEVRYAFGKQGMPLADPCWILRTSRNPASDEKLGSALMLVSVVLGVFWGLRRSRQGAKPSPVRSALSANVTRP